MFEILKEYEENYNSKTREISSVKPYFRKFSGISTKNSYEFKNECVIVIKNKGNYNNTIDANEIKYWGSSKEWINKNGKWEPIKSSKFLNRFNNTSDSIYVFLQEKKNKYIYLGSYKVTEKKWVEKELNELYILKPDHDSREKDSFLMNWKSTILNFKKFISDTNFENKTEKNIQVLRTETNINELKNYKNYNIDFSIVMQKIAEYSKIHNEQISKLKKLKIQEGYNCWEGKFSDLITEKNKQLTLYEFKIIYDKNFLSQFMKAVGQLEVYEKNFDQLDEFKNFEKNIEKKIIFLIVKKLLFKNEYIKLTAKLSNITCEFYNCY